MKKLIIAIRRACSGNNLSFRSRSYFFGFVSLRFILNAHGFCRMDVHLSRRSSGLQGSFCTSAKKSFVRISSHSFEQFVILLYIYYNNVNLIGVNFFSFFFFSYRAVEALTVVIVVKSLDPAISCFYRESTGETFCRKEIFPV